VRIFGGLQRAVLGSAFIDGKNSTEPQKNINSKTHVFWGLTKNIEKHFYHRLGGPAGGCPPALVPVVG